MRSFKSLLLSSSTVCAIALGCLGANAAEPTHLTVIGNLGITTQYKELERPFWETEIPKLSHGELKATIKPWNELGLKGPEVFQLLRSGVADVGTTQMSFLSGIDAINDATDLPGLTSTLNQLKSITTAFRPYLEHIYESKYGLKVLGLWSFQQQVLFCKSPLSSLQELKGRKVRTGGAAQSAFIHYFGGVGVNIAFGEVQQALQTGVIDCAITGALGGYTAKWNEATQYLYNLPINWATTISMMPMKIWNSLTEEKQKTLITAYKQLEAAVYEQNSRENAVGLACLSGDGPCSRGTPGSMHIVPPAPGDQALKKAALEQAILPAWAKRCGAQCTEEWNDTIGKLLHLTAQAN